MECFSLVLSFSQCFSFRFRTFVTLAAWALVRVAIARTFLYFVYLAGGTLVSWALVRVASHAHLFICLFIYSALSFAHLYTCTRTYTHQRTNMHTHTHTHIHTDTYTTQTNNLSSLSHAQTYTPYFICPHFFIYFEKKQGSTRARLRRSERLLLRFRGAPVVGKEGSTASGWVRPLMPMGSVAR
jgi:hypothetical protein